VCNELVVLLFSGMEESGVSVVRAARVCGRCFQPSRSTVVRCTSSAVPGGIDLCRRCHSFVHPGCGAPLAAVADRAAAAAAAARLPCVLCRGLDATLLCPLCPSDDRGRLFGALLCADCSAWLHAADHKMCHVDHIVMLSG